MGLLWEYEYEYECVCDFYIYIYITSEPFHLLCLFGLPCPSLGRQKFILPPAYNFVAESHPMTLMVK